VSDYAALLRTLVARRDLSAEQMTYAIGAMMDGAWSGAQAGGFLAALATKGETAAEVVGAARAMRARSLRLEHDLDVVVDTCGTGGDGAHTINVSTAAGFVLAGCGMHVAKHGNRAASSVCGSADVLEAAGIALEEPVDIARMRLEREHFAFLFAQLYHPAVRAVAPVRRELGVRTIFNILGPLANPARATHQVIGVSQPAHLALLGDALAELGGVAGAIVHARSGIDEVAGDMPTDVYQFGPQGVRRWTLEPADYGVRAPAGALAGGSPPQNAAALASILGGERSSRAEIVALNAALVLVVAGRAGDMLEGLALARASLRDGAARTVFDRLRTSTRVEYA
jgi:anthranilate phosphoribosyltransferase